MSFSIKPESAPDADFHADRAVKYAVLNVVAGGKEPALPLARIPEDAIDSLQERILDNAIAKMHENFYRAVRPLKLRAEVKPQIEAERVNAFAIQVGRLVSEDVRRLITEEFDVVGQVSVDEMTHAFPILDGNVKDRSPIHTRAIENSIYSLFGTNLSDLNIDQMNKKGEEEYLLQTLRNMTANGYLKPVDVKDGSTVTYQMTVKGLQYMAQIEEGSLERQASDVINAPTGGALKNDSGGK